MREGAGDISEFSGSSARYEPPDSPELRLDRGQVDLPRCVAAILDRLVDSGVVPQHPTA